MFVVYFQTLLARQHRRWTSRHQMQVLMHWPCSKPQISQTPLMRVFILELGIGQAAKFSWLFTTWFECNTAKWNDFNDFLPPCDIYYMVWYGLVNVNLYSAIVTKSLMHWAC